MFERRLPVINIVYENFLYCQFLSSKCVCQGDQNWEIAFFDHLFEKYRSIRKILATLTTPVFLMQYFHFRNVTNRSSTKTASSSPSRSCPTQSFRNMEVSVDRVARFLWYNIPETGQIYPVTGDVMIFWKIIEMKYGEKMSFCVQNTVKFLKTMDHHIFFRRKLAKIAENCDNNTGPRKYSKWT
jgi:hypothetical protein